MGANRLKLPSIIRRLPTDVQRVIQIIDLHEVPGEYLRVPLAVLKFYALDLYVWIKWLSLDSHVTVLRVQGVERDVQILEFTKVLQIRLIIKR